MDNRDSLVARWAIAREEIRSLTDPIRIGDRTAAAIRQYVAYVTRGERNVTIDQNLVRTAYRASLLTRAYPIENGYDADLADWYQQIDDLAQAVDIYARLSPDNARLYRRLAAHLYATAQQPTKAARIALELRGQTATPSREAKLDNILQILYSLRGHDSFARTNAPTASLLLEEGLTANSDDVDALAAALSISLEVGDSELHQWAIEAQFAARFRAVFDLTNITAELPESFVAACRSGRSRNRREELLPSQTSAVASGLLTAPVVSIATPTGSGKTFMAELRIARELARRPDALAIYVAPFNALASQIHRQMRARLGQAGWAVDLWTGAYELDDSVTDLGSILVTTPEKLDFILRSRLEDDDRYRQLRERASIFVFDESDLINQDLRGIRFEFLIRRIRLSFPEAAMMTISAVQEQMDEFSRWVAGPETPATAITVQWSPTRVIDLLWRKGGLLEARDEPAISLNLPRPANVRRAAALLVGHLLGQLQSVLLVESRKDWAEAMARELFDEYRETLQLRLAKTEARRPDATRRLRTLADEVRRHVHPNYPLADYVVMGLAFHHAGLPAHIRTEIERLAEEEIIHTLVATTTLAEGADLPFRAVILIHMNFQATPIPVGTVRNIRGRAGRPFFANEGLFIAIEPENTGSASYQYFLDYFWEQRVRPPAQSTALSRLISYDIPRRAEATRVLESQLLALYSEQEVLVDEVGSLAKGTYAAAVSPPTSLLVSRIAHVLEDRTASMLEEPGAVLTAASPIALTPYGRQVALSGLSAQSGRFLYDYLVREEPAISATRERQNLAWLAVRCAWLPWEAIERTEVYQSETRERQANEFIRSVDSMGDFEDQRLVHEYSLSDQLMEPRTYEELAARDNPRLIAGRRFEDRLANVIEWAGSASGTLAWTLTGVIRVMTHLGVEISLYRQLAQELTPYVRFIQHWVPSSVGIQLVRDVLDRDSTIRVLRITGFESDIATVSEWVRGNIDQLDELVGESMARRLQSWASQ